jgi:peptidoglycan/xylan/chitin deacetylase (PgdA/CDA1 family)
MKIFKNKKLHIIATLLLISFIIILFYPIGNKFLLEIRNKSNFKKTSYIYPYSLPKNFIVDNLSALSPAKAVPVLTYHGVIVDNKNIGTNTSLETFISQMEMLKKKGYQTISIREYDLFRENNFILPPKPIIITFDDGRKDSFYPVDDILKKLDFKATIFLATVKANEKDSFYLDWNQLKNMQTTGRWEIEAHGRNSHDFIQIDKDGNFERNYLVSKKYIPESGLESLEEYTQRVQDDYKNSINDIKENLGIDSKYFAVPLNDYGDIDMLNHENAYELNKTFTKKFFKLAFVQVDEKNDIPLKTFYNYIDSNPLELKRFSVKNTNADDLLNYLNYFSPKELPLVFSISDKNEPFSIHNQLLYGKLDTSNGIKLSSGTSTKSARMIFGDYNWKNYSVKANLIREKGQSVSLLVNYKDENNLILLNWGEKTLKIIERINGIDKEISSYYPWGKEGSVNVLIRVSHGYITAYFSEILLVTNYQTQLSHGYVGFGVWGTEGAESTIRELEIISLDK